MKAVVYMYIHTIHKCQYTLEPQCTACIRGTKFSKNSAANSKF